MTRLKVAASGLAAALLGLGAAQVVYKNTIAPHPASPVTVNDINILMGQIGHVRNSIEKIEQQIVEDDKLVKAWAAAVQRLRDK